MKKLIMTFVMLITTAAASYATPLYFSGASNGGVGSATMDISIVGNTLTMLLQNTSSTTLIDGSGPNASAVTGFGFNLTTNIAVTSWQLTAYATQTATTAMIIGSSVVPVTTQAKKGKPVTTPASPYLWTLGTTQAGVTLDYLDYLKDVKGALYNPEAMLGLAAKPNYFTDAVLTVTFASAPSLDLTPDAIGSGLVGSEYIRMQNVGTGGSLKLTPVPEPSTILLIGAGLSALVCWQRRK